MRFFKLDVDIYQINEKQYTQDEKQVLIDAAQTDEELVAANAIIACAPAGAVELTPEEVEALRNPPKTTEQRITEIESRLAELDTLSLRPLRTIAAGSAEQYDHDKLAEIYTESETLRAELHELIS